MLRLSRWSNDDTAFHESSDAGHGSSTFTHVVTGLTLSASQSRSAVSENGIHGRVFQLCTCEGAALDEFGTTEGSAASFMAEQGPGQLPSTYVKEMRDNGWTCLPALVHPEDLAVLRELRDADMVTPQERHKRMADSKVRGGEKQPFLRSSVLARMAVEPTVMYVLRQVRPLRTTPQLYVALFPRASRELLMHISSLSHDIWVTAVSAYQRRPSRPHTFDPDCASGGSPGLSWTTRLAL